MALHKNNNTLTHRLAACVERVGGKRAMANASLVSEAQLFRYVGGLTDVPAEKLVAMAKAAKVDAGWLLTGEGDMVGGAVSKDPRPSFRGELMKQIIQVSEELMVEFEKPFNPRQRSRAMTFLYNALRHEEIKRGIEYEPQKFDLLKYLNFLSELRTDEELEMLIGGLDLLEYSPSTNLIDENPFLTMWCNLLVRGMKGYYSSYLGQVYFERKGGSQLEPAAAIELQNYVMESCKLLSKNSLDWLDLGCGNGRHLVHLNKHMTNLTLRGVELSQLGYSMCKELMEAEKLPKDSVIQGDMRHLPYSAQSFDVVFSNMSLYCLPYLKGTGLGLEEAMAEIHRVLRPGGILIATFPMGEWRDYSMPSQFLNEIMAFELANNTGFTAHKLTVQEGSSAVASSEQQKARVPSNIKFQFKNTLAVTFIKK